MSTPRPLTDDELQELLLFTESCADMGGNMRTVGIARCLMELKERRLQMQRQERPTGTHAEIVEAIEFLRADEGDSVILNCDNPNFDSGLPDCVIDVCGGWTNWQERRFGGDTLLQALQAAVVAKQAANEVEPTVWPRPVFKPPPELREAATWALRQLESWQVDWDAMNRDSPDYQPDYKPQFSQETLDLRASLELPDDEFDEDMRVDAQRWRALVTSGRVRVLGTAGFDDPSPVRQLHIGLELWSHYPVPPENQQEFRLINTRNVGLVTTYADLTRQIQGLTRETAESALATEKRRRIYYQDIVYAVCNLLDRYHGLTFGRNSVVCGTVECPTEEVQQSVKALGEKLRDQDKYIEQCSELLPGNGLLAVKLNRLLRLDAAQQNALAEVSSAMKALHWRLHGQESEDTEDLVSRFVDIAVQFPKIHWDELYDKLHRTGANS